MICFQMGKKIKIVKDEARGKPAMKNQTYKQDAIILLMCRLWLATGKAIIQIIQESYSKPIID